MIHTLILARHKLTPYLPWLILFAGVLLLMLGSDALASGAPGGAPPKGGFLNSVLDPQAGTVCSEVKSLTSSRWLAVFLLIGAAIAIANIYRKQRDGWTNLGWVIVAAAVLGSVWQALAVFGITC
ncbi:hypothetical protein [Deinococcus multiflagellatus]|uniref:Conjugal transfer protein TrbC n=1 Tax=Deinococcus multiflagellatus TaxID=1656887 RepID=A0ABW1ZTD2_9DEIO|nr:hypothetical protein [Deinococcus multiflagellatus]MBZ9714439.1 hypothetical protein [Deinococcus multiflagellatus]